MDVVGAIDGSGWPVQGLDDDSGGPLSNRTSGGEALGIADRGRPYPHARRMKKSDLIDRVAGEAGITKRAADNAVDGVFAAIAEALARGEDVTVVGFGKFSTNSRPAREDRNPRTGEHVSVGPSVGVSFKAGKPQRDALN